MTRIISGFAGSRELKVPKTGTRPTSDRVREAIFSALESRDLIEQARVLDLYAGSGALALEALSRGASHVVMVEKKLQAGALLKANAELIRSSGKLPSSACSVHVTSVMSFLSTFTGEPFNIVFIDPPYELINEEITEVLRQLIPFLASEADVVLERSTRSGVPEIPQGLQLEKSKAYGETTIHWLYKA